MPNIIGRQLQEVYLLHDDLLRGRGYQPLRQDGVSRDKNTPPPWVQPPEGAVTYMENGLLAVPVIPNTGTILTVTVPLGFDGVIKQITNIYTGGGFVNGVGDLVWSIIINGAPLRNFSNITFENGSLQTPLEVSPIRIFSGQVILFQITHVANVALGANTIARLGGYFYPRKGN